MISATNTEGDGYDLGVDFVEYKEGEIYVSDVIDGPFYETGRSTNVLRSIVLHSNNLNILVAHLTLLDFPFPIVVEIYIALDRGDKILAINGKKISEHLCTVDEVFDILYSKPKMTLFVLRPRKNDKGYKWVHERD